ncbi:MAG: hypothetical protein H7X99_08190, partial [Saprospiraceae bacterium]|nr:hypothetical protein [Saprospiraceae bacterium]
QQNQKNDADKNDNDPKDNEKNDQKENDAQNQKEQKESGEDKNRKMTRQDAEKLLQVMDNEEKKVQQKLRRTDGKAKKPGKDW